MMGGLHNPEAYPTDIMLRDGDKVSVRPLEPDDKVRLLEFFGRIPEEERYYLKENVASAKIVNGWTAHMDFSKVIPIVAVAGDAIVADATLHLNRGPAEPCSGATPPGRGQDRGGPSLPGSGPGWPMNPGGIGHRRRSRPGQGRI